MEKCIDNWACFARNVETQLTNMDESYSDNYIGTIRSQITNLRDKLTLIEELDFDEKIVCFLQINKIANELKTMAHFANSKTEQIELEPA